MNKRTLHIIRGYGLLLVAFMLLVGPTLILARIHQPQLVALKMIDEQPMLLSAPSTP